MVLERVLSVLRTFVEEPRPQGSEKLEDDIYRVRVGRYRVIYKIYDQTPEVEIGSVRLRNERTYTGIHELFR
ncbi:MAG: type II toxin-antitoxin system RelE/ParE family toxin [Chloroflexi bacterium]|nr:type II toxin-antitoxin system RelE/ParE family toxin [Chloroflexota bacterium]